MIKSRSNSNQDVAGSSRTAHQIFADLRQRATRGMRLSVTDLGREVEPGGKPKRRIADPIVAGHRIEIRAIFPEPSGPFQALLLECDTKGDVWLLSSAGLLDGDIWFQNEIVIPRPLASTDWRPIGTLRLGVPGTSELLLIGCRDRNVRLDKLPFYERTTSPRQTTPYEPHPLTPEELQDLEELIEDHFCNDWSLCADELVIKPPLLPDIVGTPSPARPRNELQRPLNVEIPQSHSLMTGDTMCDTKSFPFDFPISPDQMERMRRRTEQIHLWASLPNEPVFSHDNQDAPVGRFKDYKEMADDHGLFIGGAKPGLPSLTLMQGRIAYRVHDLWYPSKDDAAERRWRVAPRGSRIEYNRRDDDFLSLLMKNNCKYGSKTNPNILGRRTISKVDMSLIAHCYQTPVEIWESRSEDLFQFWLRRAANGVDLFAYDDLRYLVDYATETSDLTFFKMPANAMEAATCPRGPIIADTPEPAMAANRPHGFEMPLPRDMQQADAFLFQADEGKLWLISTPSQVNGSPRHHGVFKQPREGRDWGGMRFAPSDTAIFFLLLVTPGTFEATDFPFFRDTLDDIPDQQIAALRHRLFRAPAGSWRLYRRTITVR